ncbi:hypothetical protein [Streptomyces sp. AC495_CC817]|uniref:hypothetical protein n=1 Tax=Streptomyces sp. AC495_CC817 TaxID=2823900 RepID=UPI001C27FB70|nr:hypothetical protein [Streptomyces sp. AC495_CC817]
MSAPRIDHGGAVSVDPEALRETASRIATVVEEFERARRAIEGALLAVSAMPVQEADIDPSALLGSRDRVEALRGDGEEAVTGVRLMADVYEYVELQVAAEVLAVDDGAAADALRLRLDRLAAADDRIPDMATVLRAGWEERRFEGLNGQNTWGGLLTPVFGAAALAGAVGGRGVVQPWMRLSGTPDPVAVAPVASSRPWSAPAGIAESLRRMPRGDTGAQVAVERYTMPDGSRRFVAYVLGTQSAGAGGREPWDMRSNVELYTGQRSASYEATRVALAASGAVPGDEVDVVAHSQAGMIAAHLALEGEYDVRVQITAGSPVSPVLGDDRTLVQLAHTDDVVRALAGGGSAGGSGSPDSFTATSVDDAVVGPTDAWRPHLLASYVELAEEVDASGDPRVEALDEFWRGLDDAVSIDRTEYRAERVE